LSFLKRISTRKLRSCLPSEKPDCSLIESKVSLPPFRLEKIPELEFVQVFFFYFHCFETFCRLSFQRVFTSGLFLSVSRKTRPPSLALGCRPRIFHSLNFDFFTFDSPPVVPTYSEGRNLGSSPPDSPLIFLGQTVCSGRHSGFDHRSPRLVCMCCSVFTVTA